MARSTGKQPLPTCSGLHPSKLVQLSTEPTQKNMQLVGSRVVSLVLIPTPKKIRPYLAPGRVPLPSSALPASASSTMSSTLSSFEAFVISMSFPLPPTFFPPSGAFIMATVCLSSCVGPSLLPLLYSCSSLLWFLLLLCCWRLLAHRRCVFCCCCVCWRLLPHRLFNFLWWLYKMSIQKSRWERMTLFEGLCLIILRDDPHRVYIVLFITVELLFYLMLATVAATSPSYHYFITG